MNVVLPAGPGVGPGERDDEDDVALSEDTSSAGVPALEKPSADDAAEGEAGSQNESHAGTSSVAPNARDQDAADD